MTEHQRLGSKAVASAWAELEAVAQILRLVQLGGERTRDGDTIGWAMHE